MLIFLFVYKSIPCRTLCLRSVCFCLFFGKICCDWLVPAPSSKWTQIPIFVLIPCWFRCECFKHLRRPSETQTLESRLLKCLVFWPASHRGDPHVTAHLVGRQSVFVHQEVQKAEESMQERNQPGASAALEAWRWVGHWFSWGHQALVQRKLPFSTFDACSWHLIHKLNSGSGKRVRTVVDRLPCLAAQ